MFEREVKFIYDFSSSKVKKLGSTATYAELIPLDLHPAIMRYIAAEIEYRVFEDRQTLLKHSMFDYSGYEISKHFSKITDEIKKEKKFSTDFISKIILHATSFNVNYLIRPNWSLKKLIFDTNDSKSVAEINQILNYTYFYKHIPKVTRDFFEKKKLITMNKNEFGDLLDKLDSASFDSYGKDLIDAAMKSIASFFNIGSMKKSIVPLQAVGVFLQEKNLTKHLAELEEKLKGETKSKIELNDLKTILFQVPLESSETFDFPKVPSEEVELEEEEVIRAEEEASEPVTYKTDDFEKETLPENEAQKEEIETTEELDEKEKFEKEDTKDEEVEIQLRSNKEKEIADTNKNKPGSDEYLEADEENDSEEDESVEYLVDEKDDKSDIILTPEDDEELATEETEVESEETQADSEKEETQDDYEELIEEQKEKEVSELEIIEDEVQHFEELPDEPDEETIEEAEETESGDKNYDDYLVDEDDDSDTEELIVEDEMEYEVNPDTPDDYSFPEEDQEKAFQDSEEFDEEEKEDDLDYLPEENESEDIVNQTTLFGDIPDESLPDETEEEKDNFIQDYASQNKAKKIDIADLLENKNMTKIIAVVFDYDMEEFANAVEKVCDSSTSQEAFATLNEIFELNDVNPSSKEAQAFREIIAEYFEQN